MSTVDMLNDPVSKYTDHHMMTIESRLMVEEAAKMMIGSEVESVLVFENSDLVGIVTMKDIFKDVVAKGKDPSKTPLKEITKKNIIKINKDEKVKKAISLMNEHNIRRLIVINEERPIGIISQKAMIGNLGKLSASLPELEIPDKVKCPYCSSLFDDKKSLSHHIDDIHIGKGILEGNLGQADQLGSINSPTNPKSL